MVHMFRRTPTDPAARRRPGWLGRLFGPSAPPPTTGIISRLEVRPPARWGQADSVWQSLWHWLREDGAAAINAPERLNAARQDFCTALNGLLCRDAQDLRQRAGHARSMRELWHLRAELYGVVARQLSQPEAERRLAPVNRHFPIGAHGPAHTTRPARHEHDLPA